MLYHTKNSGHARFSQIDEILSLSDEEVKHNFAAKVRKDPKAFKEYAKLIRDDEFKEKIKMVADDPNSDMAKEVLKAMLPILSFGGRNSTVGMLGDTT